MVCELRTETGQTAASRITVSRRRILWDGVGEHDLKMGTRLASTNDFYGRTFFHFVQEGQQLNIITILFSSPGPSFLSSLISSSSPRVDYTPTVISFTVGEK